MTMTQDYYLKIAKASDLKDLKERILFRFFEILPGVLSWGTLFLVVFLSWLQPFWISVFIIIFVIFWFFRTIYFSLHLWAGYKRMAKYEKINWIERLEKLKIKNWRNIYHLIIIPMYEEPLEIVRDAFKGLIDTDYPKNQMFVVLACEA